ncbi:hypothetical protein KIW84_UN0176 [Lathyrus oleraceus]|nr:hypothetical protein KIW84_UN0176 [Pisum sativum]
MRAPAVHLPTSSRGLGPPEARAVGVPWFASAYGASCFVFVALNPPLVFVALHPPLVFVDCRIRLLYWYRSCKLGYKFFVGQVIVAPASRPVAYSLRKLGSVEKSRIVGSSETLESLNICWNRCPFKIGDVFINQERKLGARRRSDTVLVSTINDADQGSADVAFRTPLAPYEKSKSLGSGGSMVARLKLKGIDGRAPPGVEPAA